MTDEPVRPQRAIERTGQHSNADEAMEAEVSAMLKETAEKLTEDYYERFSAELWEFGMGYPQDDPVPLQAVEGIAQALADASGYRVVLQAAVVEPIDGEPDMCRTVGAAGSRQRRPCSVWRDSARMTCQSCEQALQVAAEGVAATVVGALVPSLIPTVRSLVTGVKGRLISQLRHIGGDY